MLDTPNLPDKRFEITQGQSTWDRDPEFVIAELKALIDSKAALYEEQARQSREMCSSWQRLIEEHWEKSRAGIEHRLDLNLWRVEALRPQSLTDETTDLDWSVDKWS